MPIATDRPIAVDTRMLASLPTEAVQPVSFDQGITPGVSDLLKGFREGFITVDDIQKRLADRPVDASNRQLQLQANDFKSRRMAEEELLAPDLMAVRKMEAESAKALAPARLALQADIERTKATAQRIWEKNLNAEEGGQTARLQYQQEKAQHDMDMNSPDPQVRGKAQAKAADFLVESQYMAVVGEAPPEFIELNEAAEPLSETDWLAASLDTYVEKYAQENAPKFQLNGTPDPVDMFRIRKEGEAQFLKDSATLYTAYKNALAQQNGVAYQGTPDYYKALKERINTRNEALFKQGVGMKAFESATVEGAKTAAGLPGKITESKTKRVNPKNPMEEQDVLIRTDGTGRIVSETVLSSSPRAFTEAQSKSQKFVALMKTNDDVLTRLEQEGFDPTTVGSTIQSWKFTPNRLRDKYVKSYLPARDSWIAAHLRDVSGAAISNPEYPRAAAQFFPKDGDSPQAVQEKQARRKAAEEAMEISAGFKGFVDGDISLKTAPDNPYEAIVGKRFRAADGQEGIVTKRADGTYFLQ